ncbi:MAG: DNA/RNA non-specific endonuclease [Cyclobacteriaceae bacterium]
MNRIVIIIIVSVGFLFSNRCASAQPNLSFYYPKIKGELIEHQYYSLDYSEAHEQAQWVIYFADNYGGEVRTDNFRVDPLVSTGSASLADFKGSGYDRGHLAPAADMNISATSMSESFYMSNMSPQLPGFNRGIWKNLESLVRIWGINAHSADVVVTGPLLNRTCGTIGNGVTIPCAYYKIYADLDSNRAIGFILSNESSGAPLSDFMVSIDQIEADTGIDFFWQLDDSLENELESQVDINQWEWAPTLIPQNEDKNNTSISPSSDEITKCNGITQAGKSCKRSAGPSGYCWQHEK